MPLGLGYPEATPKTTGTGSGKLDPTSSGDGPGGGSKTGAIVGGKLDRPLIY